MTGVIITHIGNCIDRSGREHLLSMKYFQISMTLKDHYFPIRKKAQITLFFRFVIPILGVASNKTNRWRPAGDRRLSFEAAPY